MTPQRKRGRRNPLCSSSPLVFKAWIPAEDFHTFGSSFHGRKRHVVGLVPAFVLSTCIQFCLFSSICFHVCFLFALFLRVSFHSSYICQRKPGFSRNYDWNNKHHVLTCSIMFQDSNTGCVFSSLSCLWRRFNVWTAPKHYPEWTLSLNNPCSRFG